ncbi:hypothetical protein FOCC_FOCC001639 [Frankliniella occidentalis]|nr:hypothetical protein FOCC_FOCC001639 [Frankliniella occidentalis]
MVSLHNKSTVLSLSALVLGALLGGAASAALGPPSPAAADPHPPVRSTPVNVIFADDELVDNRNKTESREMLPLKE